MKSAISRSAAWLFTNPDEVVAVLPRTCETIINLIGNTTNRGGLVVRVRLDLRRYPTPARISQRRNPAFLHATLR
jgi:hypothetical protein